MGGQPSKNTKTAPPNPAEVIQLENRHRNTTGSSYGTISGGGSKAGGMGRSRSSMILKRVGSTATTDKPFERPGSRVMHVSGKSTASIRTRTASISRSEYHGDLKQTIESGLNINLIFVTFIIVFGSSFLFGYNIGVLNQPKALIQDFYNKTYSERYGEVTQATITLTWSLTTALFIPGGMIGAFLGGWLADSFGRKRTILLSHLFAFLGAALSTLCVVAKSPELLMIGRILVGVNSGLGNCIAPMFLSEIAPFNFRGAFGTLHQLSVTLGILLSSVFGIQEILGTEVLWPYLILLEVLPALVSLIVLPFLPETPRFLLLVQRNREAACNALKFYRKKEDVDADMEEMDTEDQSKTTGASTTFTLKMLLTAPDLRRPLFIAAMLQVIQQFSGINAVFFYSQGIFENAKVSKHHIPYAVIGTNAVNVIMTVITVPLMDIAGRRLLLLVPMLAMIVDLVLLTVCLVIQGWGDGPYAIAYVSIGCVIVYVIAFAVGLGPIPMMIGAELFRQGPRPKAMAIAGVVNWIGTFIIAMAFEPIQQAAKQYTFIIFVVLLALFTVFTYFFVPETKNKTFEEIANQFSPGTHIEVEEAYEDEDVFDEIPAAPTEEEGEHDQLVTLNFGSKKQELDDAAGNHEQTKLLENNCVPAEGTDATSGHDT